MILPSASEIKDIRPDDIETLAKLDASGLIVAPMENFSDYLIRIEGVMSFTEKVTTELDKSGHFELDEKIVLPAENLIPESIIEEAAGITVPLYEITVCWVPGFFLSQSLGILWGGCSYTDNENNLNLFLVRSSFATRKKWFVYRRDELISHELCHAARAVLNDHTYEEYFAYQTSPKKTRRYLGGCFRTRFDALFFLLPIMTLLVAQISLTIIGRNIFPIWPFWIASGIFPAFLLIRNHCERRRIHRAGANLRKAGISRVNAVLFRSLTAEIKHFAKLKDSQQLIKYINERVESELRWRIIHYRFIVNAH